MLPEFSWDEADVMLLCLYSHAAERTKRKVSRRFVSFAWPMPWHMNSSDFSMHRTADTSNAGRIALELWKEPEADVNIKLVSHPFRDLGDHVS
jgi:hypothetical protein